MGAAPRRAPAGDLPGAGGTGGGLVGFHPSKRQPLPGTQKLSEGIRFLSHAVIAMRAMQDWDGNQSGKKETHGLRCVRLIGWRWPIPASEKDGERSMGSVSDKIAKKLLSSRGAKVVDLAGWREGRTMALEAGLGGEGPVPAKFADVDPCYGIYALTENIVSLMAETISGMREAKGFVRIVGDAEDEYLPSGPPMSPLTVSYFAMWAFFDVRFGSSRETMGHCILRIAPDFDCPSWLIDTVERMQRSRMGFYVHCGSEGDGVLLREVGTREVVSCTVPAGYAGRKGEIWFVRVLPPPHPLCGRHIVFNTPYVIRDWPERAFVEYLERELARMEGKKTPRTDDLNGHLMKYGPNPNHWNEYIHCAYSSHQAEAIFLTGIPDIRESLPHG